MLTVVLAHAGQALAPHDLWSAWSPQPAALLALAFAVWAYRRGTTPSSRRGAGRWRTRCFTAALVTLALALLSPLDALSGALASAHMVQHVLLVLVAAPLLALSAPGAALLRGAPLALRRAAVGARRAFRSTTAVPVLHHPAAVWILHAGVLWFWHAAVPYDAAVTSEPLHVVEHASLVVTALLFWRVVVSPRRAHRVSGGFGVLLVFAMAMQSVFLSALLTFASAPWYSAYATTTAAWGLQPLADQQLAGLIMWVPAGIVYVTVALALLAAWIRASERATDPGEPGPSPVTPASLPAGVLEGRRTPSS